ALEDDLRRNDLFNCSPDEPSFRVPLNVIADFESAGHGFAPLRPKVDQSDYMASKADAVWTRRKPTSIWATNPHHPIPRVVVGFLEFVIDRRDRDHIAAMFQMAPDRLDVGRPAAVKP